MHLHGDWCWNQNNPIKINPTSAREDLFPDSITILRTDSDNYRQIRKTSPTAKRSFYCISQNCPLCHITASHICIASSTSKRQKIYYKLGTKRSHLWDGRGQLFNRAQQHYTADQDRMWRTLDRVDAGRGILSKQNSYWKWNSARPPRQTSLLFRPGFLTDTSGENMGFISHLQDCTSVPLNNTRYDCFHVYAEGRSPATESPRPECFPMGSSPITRLWQPTWSTAIRAASTGSVFY